MKVMRQMTVKIKEAIRLTPHQPRFDFDRNVARNDERTAIIKELLTELNRENGNESIGDACDPTLLREQFRQDTSEATDRILLTHIRVDDGLMKTADAYVADRTREFSTSLATASRGDNSGRTLAAHQRSA